MRRQCFQDEACLSPALRAVGWARYHSVLDRPLPRHTHEGCFELSHWRRGPVQWQQSGEHFVLRGNQLVVVLPGEPHGAAEARLQPAEQSWLQLCPRGILAASGPGASLLEALSAARQQHGPSCQAPPELSRLLAALLQECRAPDAHSRAAIEAGLLQLLVCSVRALSAGNAPPPEPSAPIRRALALAAQRHPARLDRQALAAAAGLGLSHFHARFVTEVGQSPTAWLLEQRIEAGQRLLRAGTESIAWVAAECGFRSSQQFATAFKRYTGTSPSAYRAAQAAAARQTQQTALSAQDDGGGEAQHTHPSQPPPVRAA